MKKPLLICLLVLSSISLFAQDKAALTKEETINYLNKKAEEIIGHYRTINENLRNGTTKDVKYYYFSNSVSIDGNNVIFKQEKRNYKDEGVYVNSYRTYYPCDYYEMRQKNIFNPSHILSIEKSTSKVAGEPIGVIEITLKGNTGQRQAHISNPTEKMTYEQSDHYGKCFYLEEAPFYKESSKVVYFNYLQSDDSNFNKIKKALEYLRDLFKAEDDPFGN
ncbi:MAG TPA: hypothetical protein VF677_08385 [Flavobacterium sp.]|jgi:hypothetical protein